MRTDFFELKDGKYQQLPLDFAKDSMADFIDANTFDFHFGKHHAAYTNGINEALAANSISEPILDVFAKVSKFPAAVRNQGGGYFNHAFFWKCISSKKSEPSEKLKQAIDRDFGSSDAFKEAFSKAAASQFGSGWAWLILQNGKLKVVSTPNQDNPLMDIAGEKGDILLCLDVWEHSYYLCFQNKRADYINKFWNYVNWDFVSDCYKAVSE